MSGVFMNIALAVCGRNAGMQTGKYKIKFGFRIFLKLIKRIFTHHGLATCM